LSKNNLKKMDTLKFIIDKFKLDVSGEMPIRIPNVGREDLADWIHELGFKRGVEVGVAAGKYSQILCQKNPQMKLSGVDPWLPYSGYRDYAKQSTFDKLEKEAVERLSSIPNYEFIREWSMDAVKKFEDNSLCIVYIDANHEDPFVTQDITEWSKKVKSGGIVAGHDWTRIPRVRWNVKDAILKYTKENNIKTWFVLGSDAIIPGETREGSRSWMFVKQ